MLLYSNENEIRLAFVSVHLIFGANGDLTYLDFYLETNHQIDLYYYYHYLLT